MDSPVNTHAHLLLSPSEKLEPFVPSSHQDTLYVLELLNQLEECTTHHLPKSIPAPPPQAKAQTTVKPSPSQNPSSSSLQKKSSAQDQQILEALMKLKASQSIKRRTPGAFSPIIRPD